MKSFVDRLVEEMSFKQSMLCLGLDPQVKKEGYSIPMHILKNGYEQSETNIEGVARAIVEFNRQIIEAAEPYVAIAKPQSAFYEKYGHWGIWALEETIIMCKEMGLLVLEDAKRCDGGDTAEAYAAGHLGNIELWEPSEGIATDPSVLDFDAMTVVPYIGESCLAPFLKVVKQGGKGIFVVCNTSFKPNSKVEQLQTISGLKVWEEVALLVKQWSDGLEYRGEFGSNVGVVMGATYPEDAPRMRELLPDSTFLVPGYGEAQGGGAAGAIAGIRKDRLGLIINQSRDINYAFMKDRFKCDPRNFAEASGKAAKFGRDDLNAALKKKHGKLPW